MTNYELIKEMTVYELAWFIVNLSGLKTKVANELFYFGVLEMLMQEAKDG